ncbi:hypothetical protein [Variovorax saccharolyticus]|uniref:hypothetical protein n=1 Tax=Variovorax saccharolyticus TaxID=3053516 RepID=UPI0025788197|nr:hypothetical protein [Variovorax sp. J31P216]MDM0028919.1 hypothetical protein [Variovorax sp. J31P216]
MAKSARAIAQSSKVSKSIKPATVAAKRRRVPVAKKAAPTAPPPSDPNESALAHFSDVEDAFYNLVESHRAYECLQSFLSPRFPPLEGAEEFHIEPDELRGLVTVLNADMTRQILAVRGTIRGVRERMKAGR